MTPQQKLSVAFLLTLHYYRDGQELCDLVTFKKEPMTLSNEDAFSSHTLIGGSLKRRC